MRFLKAFFHALWLGAKLPCPVWVALLLAFTISTSAAPFVLYGSLNVPSTGTATINTSLNLSGALNGTATGVGNDFLRLGNNCPGGNVVTFSNAGTAQVQGVAPSAWGNYCGTNGWLTALDTNGNMAVKADFWANVFHGTGLNLSNLTASTCVGTDASKNLTSVACGTTYTGTAPITVSGSTIACSNCAQLGSVNNTFTNNDTFNGLNVFAGPVNFTQSTANPCGTGGPNASACFGSPTQTISLAIGKVTGGWGGTTASNSGQLCFYRNNGTADSSACNYITSGGTMVLGSGAPTLSLSANTTANANDMTLHDILQHASNDFGGKCQMNSNQQCTVTLGKSYTTPICVATVQDSTAPETLYAGCLVSGTTATVTANANNSAVWAVIVIGDPS